MATRTFTTNETAQGLTITNNSGDILYFIQNATAANAILTNNTDGSTYFYNISTAGTAQIDDNDGNTYFRDTASADHATITNRAGGFLDFRESSTAASATITNGMGGLTYFENTSTAGNATINNTVGATYFQNTSTASAATITNTGTGFVDFRASSTAGTAIILNDASQLPSGSTGSYTDFENESTAGNSTITSINGGRLVFYDHSTGGSAKLITNGPTSSVEFSLTSGPNGGHKVSAGSISGSGTYYLGSNALTVGSLGLDDAVSGAIVDGGRGSGTGASLVKVGSGTLTLSGTNTYSGGTTMVGGTLALASTAAAGSGAVTFTAGAQNLRIEQAALSATSSHTLANTLAGFAADGDVIDLRGVGTNAGVSFDYLTNTLTVTNAAHATVATLHLTGSYAGYAFTASSDGAGGTKIVTSVPAAVLTAGLAHDTAPTPAPSGSTTDGVTSDPTLTGQTNAGATLTFSEGATTLGSLTTPDGNYSFAFNGSGRPALADGTHTITVTETFLGQVAKTANVTFTLDSVAPGAPTLALTNDTGSSGTDRVTRDAGLTVTQAEAGGSLAYTVDGRAVASYDPSTLGQGTHTVSATQTDKAGNVSAAGSLTFTLDSVAPGAPTLALTNDTGSSGTDRVTRDASLTVTRAEAGGSLAYTVDGRAVAAYDPAALSLGTHTVSATQTDAAGNVSAAGSLTFTLEGAAPPNPPNPTPPGAPTLALTNDTGSSATDHVTRDAGLTVTRAEAGGSLAYTVDGQAVAAYDPTALSEGTHTVSVTQTNNAGATSSAGSLTFTLDTTAPKAALSGVSGVANHETGHVLSGSLGAADAGLTVTIRDGSSVLGTATSDSRGDFSFAFVDTKDGPSHSYSLTAAATDVAGNAGTSDSLAFAFDYSANRDLFGTVAHDATSHAGQVYALYEGLLDRAPDQAGAQGWVSALDRGASLKDVTQAFLDSTEGKSHFNAQSNADFVDQLYDTVLGRDGDAGGKQAWVSALDKGASRADVADSFVFSSEHLGQLKGAFDAGVYIVDETEAGVARLYHGLLDRAPDGGGLAAWETAAQNGTSLSSIAQSVLNSSEYVSGHGIQTDQQFVESLYAHGLGRAADAGGEQNWLSALSQGASRGDVAAGVLQSAEAQAHWLGQVEQGWHLA